MIVLSCLFDIYRIALPGFPVKTAYPKATKWCGKHEPTTIGIESISGFELTLPANCLKEGIMITATVFYSDPPYNFGIDRIQCKSMLHGHDNDTNKSNASEFALITPIIQLQHIRLQFNCDETLYPRISLPVMCKQSDIVHALDGPNVERNIFILQRKNLHSSWSVVDTNVTVHSDSDGNRLSFCVDDSSYYCGLIKVNFTPQNTHSIYKPNSEIDPCSTIRIQQVVNVRTVLEITKHELVFMKLIFERYGIRSRSDTHQNASEFELQNDITGTTLFKNGFHNIEICPGKLKCKPLDGDFDNEWKNIHIDWNDRDEYTVVFQCMLSDNVVTRTHLCQIVVYEPGSKKTVKMSIRSLLVITEHSLDYIE